MAAHHGAVVSKIAVDAGDERGKPGGAAGGAVGGVGGAVSLFFVSS